jgi:hypothetical protein
MNCRNLETIITELARGQMLEASVKEEALAHMETCKRCAGRFADEQSLTAGLRAIAASSASMETPARVEAALLAAFRQQTVAPFKSSAAPASRPRWLPLSIAAAAAILIVSALAVQFMPSGNSSETAQSKASLSQPSLVSTEPAEGSNTSDPGAGDERAVDDSQQSLIVTQSSPRPLNKGRSLMRNAASSSNQFRSVNNLEAPANTDEEITTDFLPLTYGSSLAQMDGGQVVRVELPRSALQSFGLPLNAERAGERVKADVLVGHDGVARAIRFIR